MDSGIVFFDIETTSLNGSYGRMLCMSYMPLESDEPVNIRNGNLSCLWDDRALVKSCKKVLEDSWIWVGWNSKMFDVPVINARLRANEIEPLELRLQIDLMYYSKGQFMRVGGSSLEKVSKSFDFKNKKFDVLPREWAMAGMGDEGCLDMVCEHCNQDVRMAKEAFYILKPFIRNIHM